MHQQFLNLQCRSLIQKDRCVETDIVRLLQCRTVKSTFEIFTSYFKNHSGSYSTLGCLVTFDIYQTVSAVSHYFLKYAFQNWKTKGYLN